jgi:XTP/dITP diphosphohydrolase
VVLVLATENRHKAEEIRSILKGGIQLELRTLADFPGVKLPPETGATYRENAVQKARAAADATGHWAMGDDSGLEVAALGGAPGLYSARFAGEGVTYADNRKKLLDALGDLPDEKRGAAFVCTIAISSPKGEIDVVKGVCEGSITRSEAGGGGFGYDPIFFIPAYRKTFAELPAAEKNKISHRARAVGAAMEILRKKMGPEETVAGHSH